MVLVWRIEDDLPNSPKTLSPPNFPGIRYIDIIIDTKMKELITQRIVLSGVGKFGIGKDFRLKHSRNLSFVAT